MNDDFENRIQRQPLRQAPSQWREEILSAARNATDSVHAPSATPRGLLVILRHYFGSVLQPQRVAWAILAAAWVVIIALNIAAHDDRPGVQASRAATAIPPEALQALKQQRLLLAELVGRPESLPINRPKSQFPGPRSERREETATA